MNPRDAQPGRVVALLDPSRVAWYLTNKGRLPLVGFGGHPAPVAALREQGIVLRASEGRALVAFPSAPHGLWLDLAELHSPRLDAAR